MKSPIIIIIELLGGLIISALDTIRFVAGKLGELILSLMFMSTLGVFGLLIAAFIGTVVFFLMTKFIFKTSRSLLAFIVAAAVVFIVLVIISLI